MANFDLFENFRWLLFIVVTIYCTIVMTQQAWTWYVWLMTDDRYITMLRRYMLVHGLRLRFRTFWGDVLICGLLCVVFAILFWAHTVLLGWQVVLT
jgi:hypothetical protein